MTETKTKIKVEAPKKEKAPKAPKLTIDTPQVSMKVGETDKSGWVLHFRKGVGERVVDVWGSPKGKSFVVAFAITDTRGEVKSKASTLAEAKADAEKLIASL